MGSPYACEDRPYILLRILIRDEPNYMNIQWWPATTYGGDNLVTPATGHRKGEFHDHSGPPLISPPPSKSQPGAVIAPGRVPSCALAPTLKTAKTGGAQGARAHPMRSPAHPPRTPSPSRIPDKGPHPPPHVARTPLAPRFSRAPWPCTLAHPRSPGDHPAHGRPTFAHF